jgi:hypothetical protein
MNADLIQAALKEILAEKQDHVAGSIAHQRMERAEAALLALAERALEPQGQALPELPSFEDDDAGRKAFVLGYNAAIRASQLALPAGPVPEGFVLVPMHLNAEMREVLSEEDWTWEDLLVAANAVTEEQYYAIQNGDDSSPAVAQPVADEHAKFEREFSHLNLQNGLEEGIAAYIDPKTQGAWEGWQARAALCPSVEDQEQ